MEPEDPVFNSGVMLVDVEQWKSQQCFQRLMKFCNEHPEDLLAADQTALNVLFARDCYHLPAELNVILSTVSHLPVPEKAVFHFVGSPKPWDVFGEFFHPYTMIWEQALSDTALRFMQRNAYCDLKAWRRLPRIFGGYRRVVKQRLELLSQPIQR
jgi:lipopolysaccharide biosynthesis glycosyltransferase